MTLLPAALTRLSSLATAVAALALAGCGDNAKLLPAPDASKIDTALQQVVDATDSGNCPAATSALGRAQNAFSELPAAVSAELRKRIAEGLAQLTDTVPAQCAEATATPPSETTTTEPTTETTTTVPAPTGPTGPQEQTPTGPTGEPNGGVAPPGNGPDGEGPPGQLKKGGTGGEEGQG
jgi:hypothetical protein